MEEIKRIANIDASLCTDKNWREKAFKLKQDRKAKVALSSRAAAKARILSQGYEKIARVEAESK